MFHVAKINRFGGIGVYKSSQFNCSIPLNDGGMMIRNLFTNAVLRIKPEHTAKVKMILDNPTDALKVTDSDSITIASMLEKHGMIVDRQIIEYQHVNAFRRSIAYDRKLDLTIMPTNDCNFRCVYCFEEERTQYMSDENVDGIINFLNRNLAKFISVNIQWFGGEPLLCKDIIDRVMTAAIEYSKRDKVALTSGITTNGYLLDLDTYKKLCKYHMIWMQISIDGTKATHNTQRPHKTDPDSYQRIIDNLKTIRDNTLPGMCRIYFRITVSKMLIPYMDEILEFYQKEFSKDSRFRLSIQPVMDWGGERIESQINKLPTVKETVSCLYKAADLGLMPIGHHTQSKVNLVCEANRRYSYTLYPGFGVYKCPMAVYSLRDGDLNHGKIGEISKDGTMKINAQYVTEWSEGEPALGEVCTSCTYYSICHGGQTCPFSLKFLNIVPNGLCKKKIYDEYIPAELYAIYLSGKYDGVI